MTGVAVEAPRLAAIRNRHLFQARFSGDTLLDGLDSDQSSRFIHRTSAQLVTVDYRFCMYTQAATAYMVESDDSKELNPGPWGVLLIVVR